jgi:alpha-1,3-glucan synthase
MLLNTVLIIFLQSCVALRFDPSYSGYNLNENETATYPRDYWGQWGNHTYQTSPENWRFPFYALTIDRYIDGDPTNNEANGTVFEHHWLSNQFRFGGDVAGIQSDLDYLQGLGIKAIYFTGSMMINMPWSADGYGPLDFTLLDGHHGDITEWRALIDDIHSRDMYVIFDTTMSTMGNLLGYEGKYMNTSVQFNFDEYDMFWKVPERRYLDFDISNTQNESCQLPRVWEQNGYLELKNITDQYHGCRESEFDQYGDIKSTGSYPSYVNQFSRFASVQDRLREWRPDILEKINVMSCMQIAMLDIDGFRVDKAVQVTIDALATWSDYQRQCARRFGKDNFLVVGEVVADPRLGAVYFGRGKQPDQALTDPSQAVYTSQDSNASSFIRPFGSTALDGASFDYDIYGSMTRFLGLDGPWGSLGVDWVHLWNQKLITGDMVNSNTGVFDPRHIYGMTNQDVFRWPALANGTQRQLLGFFVVVLELPGIPMVFFGEEQEFYALENLAPDYVFGRTPMVSNTASQLHGCYGLGEEVYVDMPFDRVLNGCHDDTISLDHRDPSHPMRNILKRMFELREQYPVLNDGFNLTTLSTRIYDIYLPGSGGLPSPHGIWSVYRGRSAAVQNFTGTGHGNLPVWLLFHNENRTVTYNFDCSSLNSTSQNGSLISAFSQGTTVKNLFYPYDVYTLDGSAFSYSLEGSDEAGGCIPEITFRPWEYKAFVPIAEWQQPKPVITWVFPTHDQRILSSVAYDQTESIQIEIGFSTTMNCDSVADSLQIESTTHMGVTATLNRSSVVCEYTYHEREGLVGEIPTTFFFRAELNDVANGVHTFTVDNPTTDDGTLSTQTRDKFMFRIGLPDNPMVFIRTANYTQGILHRDPDSGSLFVSTKAAGADKMRYSTNWGSSWSEWQNYTGENTTLQMQDWSGTESQEWEGEHVILQYWSRMTGSTDYVQHSDLDREDLPPRRWPHAWVEGIWNQWGFDAGVTNALSQNSDGDWTFNLFTEWPTNVTINVWGMNPDGQPDKSAAYGDVDRDGVLDWIPPDSLSNNVINISASPSQGYLGWQLVINDGNYSYSLVPYGSAVVQIVVLALLSVVPVVTAALGVLAFMGAFYKVKFNKAGTQANKRNSWNIPGLGINISITVTKRPAEKAVTLATTPPEDMSTSPPEDMSNWPLSSAVAVDAGSPGRRKVLIATMEYEIEDWAVKIKIGGLGVMASLMGKNLSHQDLIWVVPCVGGIDFPFEAGMLILPFY